MKTTFSHPRLVHSLRRAYSAERAACYAYIGHAASLKDPGEIEAVRRIERDEWDHRHHVGEIMARYGIRPSRYLEFKFALIGRIIGLSCHLIGRFMPYFFAGKLESGNVCEYFVMIDHFHSLGITAHDDVLYEMGVREKEHEVHFLDVIKNEPWLPLFERLFHWGKEDSLNDVDLQHLKPVERSTEYCRFHPDHRGRVTEMESRHKKSGRPVGARLK